MKSLLKTFKMGGVHPLENKERTAGLPIERFAAPKKAAIPLSMHLGAPCEPIVKKGESVRTGQKIADSDKAVSAPIHASITGTVKAIEHFNHPLGPRVRSIIIEGDGTDTWIEGVEPSLFDKDAPCEVDFSKSAEFLSKIREAGIVGMGGATFPTHIKLSPPPDKKIDTLILNGAECEPYLTADHVLMLERPRSILLGMRIMQEILKVQNVIISIENNKPDAVEAMRKAAEGYADVTIAVCQTRYPEGGEKQLINAVLGREVPSGKLPMEVGSVVQNVGTAFAVYEAVALHKPLIERVLTVTGPAIRHPKNLLARIGTPFKDILNYCGYEDQENNKVIMGGPMMGKAQKYLDVPVVKGTSGILGITAEEVVVMEHRPCIRCGQCVQACPMGLNPTLLAASVENEDMDDLLKNGLMDCMECGACAFICPSQRQLVHWIAVGKMRVKR